MSTTPNPLVAIRDPEKIRTCLARAVREADVLRRLLRLAESVDLKEFAEDCGEGVEGDG
jgi:hypothetical protein